MNGRTHPHDETGTDSEPSTGTRTDRERATRRTETRHADRSEPRLSRRGFLAGSTATTLALAGCLGGGDEADDGQPTETEQGLELDEVVLHTGFPIQLVHVETEEVRTEVHYHDSEFQHWHSMPLSIPRGETEQFRIRIVDPQREPISLGPDAPLQLQVTDAGAPQGLADITVDGERITVTGNRTGEGGYDVALLENGEQVLDIDPLVIRVE